MFYSCSEEFLTKSPQGATSENVFYSEKGIDALLTGTYGMVKGSALWTVSWGASITNRTYGSAAKAIAARAYLQELKYAEAKPLLNDIITSGQF